MFDRVFFKGNVMAGTSTTDTTYIMGSLLKIFQHMTETSKKVVLDKQDSTIYEELVRIRKAVENEVVVSSE